MENKEDEKLGRLGSTASVRFKPHTETLLEMKKKELGKSRSDTIRYIVDICDDNRALFRYGEILEKGVPRP